MARGEKEDTCEIIETLRSLRKAGRKIADHVQLIGTKLGVKKIPRP